MTTPEFEHQQSSRSEMSHPRFRSGAVARMAGMPVATLRIWEQRYQAVSPAVAASGHRLYSEADVERVVLLRQLTLQGHTIGLLSGMDTTQLRSMLRRLRGGEPAGGSHLPRPPGPLRIVVVGQTIAHRLRRLAEGQAGGPALHLAGVFDSLADAAQAGRGSDRPAVDVLLWQAASLQPGAGHELRLAKDAWHAHYAAVVYRYSSAASRAELTSAGAALWHEPADIAALGRWLGALGRAADQPDEGVGRPSPVPFDPATLINQPSSRPRFSDTDLLRFAELSSGIACECPSHLANLLLQISGFEVYSGDCSSSNAADAQLHAYLQRAAAAARMLLETALERVAVAEGFPLPASPA